MSGQSIDGQIAAAKLAQREQCSADEFTPTTEQVRATFPADKIGGGALTRADFARWLAAHDGQVAAAEREACAQIVEDAHGSLSAHITAQ